MTFNTTPLLHWMKIEPSSAGHKMPSSEPVEFVSSRWKTGLGLLISLGFVSIAIFIPKDQSGSWHLWSGGFFDFCTVGFAWLLMRPQRLRLDEEGFTLSGGISRTRRIKWQDVSEFYVKRIALGSSMVAFRYSPEAEVLFAGALGRSGGIPDLFESAPETMVWQLNEYKDRILGSS